MPLYISAPLCRQFAGGADRFCRFDSFALATALSDQLKPKMALPLHSRDKANLGLVLANLAETATLYIGGHKI